MVGGYEYVSGKVKRKAGTSGAEGVDLREG